MSEYLGKEYVLKQRPGAHLAKEIFSTGYEICLWDGDDCLILGRGKNPEDAWHDAAVDTETSLGTPERDKGEYKC